MSSTSREEAEGRRVGPPRKLQGRLWGLMQPSRRGPGEALGLGSGGDDEPLTGLNNRGVQGVEVTDAVDGVARVVAGGDLLCYLPQRLADVNRDRACRGPGGGCARLGDDAQAGQGREQDQDQDRQNQHAPPERQPDRRLCGRHRYHAYLSPFALRPSSCWPVSNVCSIERLYDFYTLAGTMSTTREHFFEQVFETS